jgi:hypothetical protein
MIMMKAERGIHITMEPPIPHIRKVLTSETRKTCEKSSQNLANLKPGTSKQKVKVSIRKNILLIKSLSHSCTCTARRCIQLSGIRELAVCVTVRKTYENYSSEHRCKNNVIRINIYILLQFKKSRNLYYNWIYIFLKRVVCYFVYLISLVFEKPLKP